jgi:hypothetical protein
MLFPWMAPQRFFNFLWDVHAFSSPQVFIATLSLAICQFFFLHAHTILIAYRSILLIPKGSVDGV